MCISVYVCTHAYLIYINIYIFHIASSQTHALNQVKKSSECENGIMNVKKSFKSYAYKYNIASSQNHDLVGFITFSHLSLFQVVKKKVK